MTNEGRRRALGLIIAIGLGLAGVLVGALPAAADGVAVYPTRVGFEDALRGGEYFRTVGVTNISDTERVFRFESDGPAAPWLSFVDSGDRAKPVDKLTVAPRAESHVLLRLAVPGEAPNGQYTANVRVLASLAPIEQKDKGAGASVSVGAEIAVTVAVGGTQKLAAAVEDIAVDDTEVGYPVRLKATIRNSGNVLIVPEIRVKLTAGSGAAVAEKSFGGNPVYANENRVITAELDTKNMLPGDYVARVSITAASLDLGSRDLRFKLLPPGTLTRQGTLERLELVNRPVPGSVAKFRAVFVNTGKIDSKATFIGELYRGSTLVKAITGVERLVPAGERASLEVFVDVPQGGRYTLKGKVSFEGKDTESKELTFQVAGAAGRPAWMYGAGGALAAVVLLAAAGGWLLLRRRRSAARRAAAPGGLVPPPVRGGGLPRQDPDDARYGGTTAGGGGS